MRDMQILPDGSPVVRHVNYFPPLWEMIENFDEKKSNEIGRKKKKEKRDKLRWYEELIRSSPRQPMDKHKWNREKAGFRFRDRPQSLD